MGQGGINQFQAPKSPLEGISHALQIAHSVYGINTELAQQKLAGIKSEGQTQENQRAQDKETENSDPNSQKSLLAKANALATTNAMVKRGVIAPEDASPIFTAIKDPKTSFSTLEDLKDNSALKLAVADSTERGATAKADAIVKAANVRGAVTQQNVGIRKGNQAAHAADQFMKDPVIKVASQQQSQIDKASGRIADIEAGKLPFSKQTKSDIEKDIANILSGGGSSALGVQERIEFEPLTAKYNDLLGRLKGQQMDIGAPAYLGQMKTMLGGLQNDIAGIKQRRSQYIADNISPAYQNNDLAKQTIAANLKTHAAPVVTESQGGNSSAMGGDPTILEYAKAHSLDYPHAAEILKGRGYTGASK